MKDKQEVAEFSKKLGVTTANNLNVNISLSMANALSVPVRKMWNCKLR
jgi:hypothetical protein